MQASAKGQPGALDTSSCGRSTLTHPLVAGEAAWTEEGRDAAPEPAEDAVEPPIELMVGGIVHAYLDAFERAVAGQEIGPDDDHDGLLVRGIRDAHDDFLAHLDRAVADARRATALLEERLRRDGAGTTGAD
jgi:hypothetical protein